MLQLSNEVTTEQHQAPCHSNPPSERHTLHQSILVQDFTLAQKFYGSNILALEHSKMREVELVMKGWI